MKRVMVVCWGMLLLWSVVLALPQARAAEPVRFGVLNVLDTLPLQVAEHDGLFAAHGLDVELVPFASAMERDVAIQAGRLDGYFGDLIAALLLLQQGRPYPVGTVSYRTTPGQPMFGVALAPGYAQTHGSQLRGARIGYSRSTIMEYLLEKVTAANGLAPSDFERIEIKKIPIRLQMLLSDQIDAAILPEPLLSLARLKGGPTAWTTEQLDLPLTVLCLHERYSRGEAEVFRSFMAAYREALEHLRAQPDQYRTLMAETCRIPKPLVQDFPVYEYPDPALPTEAEVQDVQDWMTHNDMLDASLPYAGVVVSIQP